MNRSDSSTEYTPEEKEKLGKLYLAYQKNSLPMIGFSLFGAVVVLLDIVLRKGHPFKIAMFLIGFCICIPLVILWERRRKAWLKSLTEDDKDLLQRAVEMPINRLHDPSKLAREILKEYRQIEVNAEKELLRASTPAPADQLLRPTTIYTETPQEEMLRASEGRQ